MVRAEMAISMMVVMMIMMVVMMMIMMVIMMMVMMVMMMALRRNISAHFLVCLQHPVILEIWLWRRCPCLDLA